MKELIKLTIIIKKINKRKYIKISNRRKKLNISKSSSTYSIVHKKYKSNHSLKYIKNKPKAIFKKVLKIDFNYESLIIFNDDEIDKDDLNNIPYTQALRIDKRSYIQILFSMIKEEFDLLNIIFLRNKSSHLSLLISIYIMDLLLEFGFNCFFYADDYISEKYHNNGELKMSTSLLVSTMSNILSSIITYIVKTLTEYYEILESVIQEIKERGKYLCAMYYFIKRTKIFLSIFYFLQLILNLMMTYHATIFCIVYHDTQISVFTNYLIGVSESLSLSLGFALIFSCMRYLGLKFHSKILYNTSKYLLNHF